MQVTVVPDPIEKQVTSSIISNVLKTGLEAWPVRGSPAVPDPIEKQVTSSIISNVLNIGPDWPVRPIEPRTGDAFGPIQLKIQRINWTGQNGKNQEVQPILLSIYFLK